MTPFLPRWGMGTMQSMVEGADQAAANTPSTATWSPSPNGEE